MPSRLRAPMLRGAVLVGTLAACAGEPVRKAPDRTIASPPPSATEIEEHEHAAPHGGTLVELGEEFAHLEFVRDTTTGRLVLYVLDGEAEVGVPLTARVVAVSLAPAGDAGALLLSLDGQGNALTGETVGNTSVFSATSPRLVGARAVQGSVSRVEVRGQVFENVSFTLR